MLDSNGMVRTAYSLLLTVVVLFGGLSSASGQSEDEEAVKKLVETFLIAVGDGDLNALPGMFAANANIGTASLRDGSWVASTMTFEKWLKSLEAEVTWTRFREPVTKFTVHVEDAQMAFVRADATVFVDEQALSHNIDNFTLVREDGTWKFLSASYIAKPIASD